MYVQYVRLHCVVPRILVFAEGNTLTGFWNTRLLGSPQSPTYSFSLHLVSPHRCSFQCYFTLPPFLWLRATPCRPKNLCCMAAIWWSKLNIWKKKWEKTVKVCVTFHWWDNGTGMLSCSKFSQWLHKSILLHIFIIIITCRPRWKWRHTGFACVCMFVFSVPLPKYLINQRSDLNETLRNDSMNDHPMNIKNAEIYLTYYGYHS